MIHFTKSIRYQWIHNPKTEPEIFINDFMSHAVGPVSFNDPKLSEVAECVRLHFRSGYCWHFATMLKSAFNRGEICWAAPLNHFVWRDIDGICYDIEGKYEEHINGDAFYFIPEKYLGEYINGFKHISPESDKEYRIICADQLICIVKQYCTDMNIAYDERIEYYFKNAF